MTKFHTTPSLMNELKGYHADSVALALRSESGYDRLADEYYCAQKHPTCANFATLHRLVLDILRPWLRPGEMCVEVGCGKGQLDQIADPSQVVLTDLSERMLSLARQRTHGRIPCHRMNAFDPHFPNCSLGGVAGFLADSYNHPSFYRSMRRVLKPGGFLAVTLPNYEWAMTLRRRLKIPPDETLFLVDGHDEVTVPSITEPVEMQCALLTNLGYKVVYSTTMTLSLLSDAHPSHHVQYASEELGIRAADVPLLDLYIAVWDGH